MPNVGAPAICTECGHPIVTAVCPCIKMDFLYEERGRKYFKKLCSKCNRRIYSRGARGLASNDFHYEFCGDCLYKIKISDR